METDPFKVFLSRSVNMCQIQIEVEIFYHSPSEFCLDSHDIKILQHVVDLGTYHSTRTLKIRLILPTVLYLWVQGLDWLA